MLRHSHAWRFTTSNTDTTPRLLSIEDVEVEYHDLVREHILQEVNEKTAKKLARDAVKAGGLFCACCAHEELTFRICEDRRSHFALIEKSDTGVASGNASGTACVCLDEGTLVHVELQKQMIEYRGKLVIVARCDCPLQKNDCVRRWGPFNIVDGRMEVTRRTAAGATVRMDYIATIDPPVDGRSELCLEFWHTHRTVPASRAGMHYFEVRVGHGNDRLDRLDSVTGQLVLEAANKLGPCVNGCVATAAHRAAVQAAAAVAEADRQAQLERERQSALLVQEYDRQAESMWEALPEHVSHRDTTVERLLELSKMYAPLEQCPSREWPDPFVMLLRRGECMVNLLARLATLPEDHGAKAILARALALIGKPTIDIPIHSLNKWWSHGSIAAALQLASLCAKHHPEVHTRMEGWLLPLDKRCKSTVRTMWEVHGALVCKTSLLNALTLASNTESALQTMNTRLATSPDPHKRLIEFARCLEVCSFMPNKPEVLFSERVSRTDELGENMVIGMVAPMLRYGAIDATTLLEIVLSVAPSVEKTDGMKSDNHPFVEWGLTEVDRHTRNHKGRPLVSVALLERMVRTCECGLGMAILRRYMPAPTLVTTGHLELAINHSNFSALKHMLKHLAERTLTPTPETLNRLASHASVNGRDTCGSLTSLLVDHGARATSHMIEYTQCATAMEVLLERLREQGELPSLVRIDWRFGDNVKLNDYKWKSIRTLLERTHGVRTVVQHARTPPVPLVIRPEVYTKEHHHLRADTTGLPNDPHQNLLMHAIRARNLPVIKLLLARIPKAEDYSSLPLSASRTSTHPLVYACQLDIAQNSRRRYDDCRDTWTPDLDLEPIGAVLLDYGACPHKAVTNPPDKWGNYSHGNYDHDDFVTLAYRGGGITRLVKERVDKLNAEARAKRELERERERKLERERRAVEEAKRRKAWEAERLEQARLRDEAEARRREEAARIRLAEEERAEALRKLKREREENDRKRQQEARAMERKNREEQHAAERAVKRQKWRDENPSKAARLDAAGRSEVHGESAEEVLRKLACEPERAAWLAANPEKAAFIDAQLRRPCFGSPLDVKIWGDKDYETKVVPWARIHDMIDSGMHDELKNNVMYVDRITTMKKHAKLKWDMGAPAYEQLATRVLEVKGRPFDTFTDPQTVRRQIERLAV